MNHPSPDFRPKDSRFGMARLDENDHAVQPALRQSDNQQKAQTGLPPIRKASTPSITQARTSFSISLFGRLLGTELLEASAHRVRAKLPLRSDLCCAEGIVENPALFTFADMTARIGLGLAHAGIGFRVSETKTHVFEAAKVGLTLIAEATPLHAGTGTTVWQTRILAGERQIALMLQTCIFN